MARQVDVASIYVAKRMNHDIQFLVDQGVLTKGEASTLQYPILPLINTHEVPMHATNYHACNVIEPIKAVRTLGAGPPAGPPPENFARALYDYQSSAYDELPLRAGDLVVITEKTSSDWYRGRIKGSAEGKGRLFPANYVEELPAPPPSASGYHSNPSGSPYYASPPPGGYYASPPPPGAPQQAPDGAKNERWSKFKKSPAGQAAIGGAAFGAAAGLASSIF